MVDLYCSLIIAKRRHFTDIPTEYKDKVQKRLYDLGYDTSGDLLTEEVST